MLASCDGHCRLVTSQDNGNESRPMCIWVLGDEVLVEEGREGSVCVSHYERKICTHCFHAQSMDMKPQ